MVGARPRESSSIMSSSGRVIERAAEGEHLLLAAGEVPGHLPGPLLEDREEGLDLRLGGVDAVLVLADQPRRQPQVLRDRQRGEHALAAGHQRDAAVGGDVGGEVGDVLALEVHGAGLRADEAADALQQRRLAGAVGAEQGDDLAGGHVEVDLEQDLHRPVGHVDRRGTTASGRTSRVSAARRGGRLRRPRGRGVTVGREDGHLDGGVDDARPARSTRRRGAAGAVRRSSTASVGAASLGGRPSPGAWRAPPSWRRRPSSWRPASWPRRLLGRGAFLAGGFLRGVGSAAISRPSPASCDRPPSAPCSRPTSFSAPLDVSRLSATRLGTRMSRRSAMRMSTRSRRL